MSFVLKCASKGKQHITLNERCGLEILSLILTLTSLHYFQFQWLHPWWIPYIT